MRKRTRLNFEKERDKKKSKSEFSRQGGEEKTTDHVKARQREEQE